MSILDASHIATIYIHYSQRSHLPVEVYLQKGMFWVGAVLATVSGLDHGLEEAFSCDGKQRLDTVLQYTFAL